MTKLLRVNGIVEESIVDGPGIRYAVFTQGCHQNCVGCHNPETHDLAGGYTVDIESIIKQFESNPLLAGITFSGGEPFLQPEPLTLLAKKIHDLGKNVMIFSGYTYEQLKAFAQKDTHIAKLLAQTDILVDGPYVDALRDLELEFRGSRNQNITYLTRM